MKLVCISDTHGDHLQVALPAGDVLVHAGDLTAHGRETETLAFMQWFGAQAFAYKVCIAGNHDRFMEADPGLANRYAKESGVILLNDSGVDIEGISFWGSPITPRFFDWSFMRDPGPAIEAHWKLIPKHTDVLITHGPPHGILDQVQRNAQVFEHTGCPSLLTKIRAVKPALHLFGHIHEGHGRMDVGGVSHFNISTMNEHYRVKHQAVEIELPDKRTGDTV